MNKRRPTTTERNVKEEKKLKNYYEKSFNEGNPKLMEENEICILNKKKKNFCILRKQKADRKMLKV